MGKISLLFWAFVLCSWIRGTSADCTGTLGMESGYIKDGQIRASSQSIDFFKPAMARLNLKQGGSAGGWCADVNDQNAYLQIDLLTPHTITKVATQGGPHNNWIEKYTLSFSYDNITWFNYNVNGKLMIFIGNRDDSSTVWRKLTQPLTVRVLRIHPITVDIAISPCARVELYGCKPSEDCNTPVGVADRTITNQQMKASSYWEEYDASNGRLNNTLSIDSSGTVLYGGWCTDRLDLHQYLQIDLGWMRSVSGVATQGLGDMEGNYVSQYKLSYSTDGSTWKWYREPPESRSKIFQGNWDKDTVTRNMFPRRTSARFIRFNPISWNKSGYICMRVEIYECLPTKGSVPRVSPPSETVDLNRTSSVNLTCLVSGQPGIHMEWYKNRRLIPAPPLSQIHRSRYANGSARSVLTLSRVKYKDRGSIISCSAWYPTLSINSTRNIHLIVHAPRPVMVISDVQSRQVLLHVNDPTPANTAKYLVRYKKDTGHSPWLLEEQSKTGHDGDTWITLHSVHPYTAYTVEVASSYKDQDEGPYSVPKQFITKQAAPSGPPRDVLVIPRGKNTIRVSWSIPSAKDCNGKMTKYEVVLYKQHGVTQTYLSEVKTLSKDISGLEPNQQYYIGVRAYTRVGPGPYCSNHSYSTGVHYVNSEVRQGSQITQALEKLNKVPVTRTNALKVMKEVRNITSKPSELLQKDLSITANILGNVVKTNVTSADVGDHVLETISHVMDAKPEVLQEIQQMNNRSAQFVQILEDYIDKGGKFSKDTPNIAVSSQLINTETNNIDVSIKTSVHKIAINVTVNSTNKDSEASITIPSSILNANNTDNTTLIVVYYRTSKLFAPDYRRTEVCEDSFTTEKVERSESSSYTTENSTGNRVTESSPVLSASLRNKHVANLNTPVIIKFKMPHVQAVGNSTRCVWWDFQKRGWSTAGCSLRGIINDTIICECSHMTNFAALVDMDGPSSKACGKHSTVLSLISYIGCALSILGLTLTIFTFAVFKKLRKDQIAAKILLHLCASLLCVLIVFVSGVERGSVSEDACRIVAALVHYFLLVAFLWMLIEAYFMYQAFVKVFRDYGDYVMWKCSALGWGLPFIVVVVTSAVDKTSYGGKHYCRLGDVAFYAAFVAPVVFVILINTATFCLIMYKLAMRPPNAADPDRGSENLLKIKRAFGILILVGITWMFGFFAVADARLVFHYLFAICNSLQGFAIFMFYCVIQKKVRECWWALVTCNLRSLQKSKSLYTDSYDRRRLSSASRVQLDAMRARSNTGISQILQMPLRPVTTAPPDVVLDCHHHGNKVYAGLPVKPSDYQLNDLSGSQTKEIHDSMDDISTGISYQSVSRSPSLRSHGITVSQSQNPSVRGSRATVNSAQSTPKMLRLPRIHALRPVGPFKGSRDSKPCNNIPMKENLKRTASHTPEVTRPAKCSSLRRTKSASDSLGDDTRFSADFSTCSDQTSCESLSSEAGTPTRKQYIGIPVDYLGVPIVGPQRGSIRGIVGYVETTVENFDLLINLERKRSMSSPVASFHKV